MDGNTPEGVQGVFCEVLCNCSFHISSGIKGRVVFSDKLESCLFYLRS